MPKKVEESAMARQHGGRIEGILRQVAAEDAPVVPVLPSKALRVRVMESMARRGAYGRFADRVARLFELPIERAEELLARIEDAAAFYAFRADGVAMLPVALGPTLHAQGAVGGFGRLAPESRFPHHEHLGDETTLVLTGGLRDEDGSELWRGEELFKPAGSSHDFTAIGGEVCIAAVLALKGVLFR